MMNSQIHWIIRFILLVLVQIWVLDYIFILDYARAQIYLLFILIYPSKVKDTKFLFIAFLLGLCIDFFNNTGGINALATLITASLKVPLIKIFKGYLDEKNYVFNFFSLSKSEKYIYIFSLIFVHHLLIFSLEYWSYKHFGTIFIKSLANSLFSGIVIILSIFFFFTLKKIE